MIKIGLKGLFAPQLLLRSQLNSSTNFFFIIYVNLAPQLFVVVIFTFVVFKINNLCPFILKRKKNPVV